MKNLSATKSILHRGMTNPERSVYFAPDDEGRELHEHRSLVLDADDWKEMGSPDELTVTIEVGDTVNG